MTTQEQLDRIHKKQEDFEKKFDDFIYKMNGNGKLGFFGKVNILWSASIWYVGICSSVLCGLMLVVIRLILKG